MNSNLNKNEVLQLEKRYWDAMKKNDVEAAIGLTKFPCIITSPQGIRRVDEQEYRQIMRSMQADQYKDIEIAEPQVTILNEDTAMIAYNVESEGLKMVNVSTWIRDQNKWVCAFHSETPLQ